MDHLAMTRIPEGLRRFLDSRSISFRLYLIIIPTTIVAILLISQVEPRIAAHLLERRVIGNTKSIADRLAAELSARDEPPSRNAITLLLAQVAETTSYVTRIDVFLFADGVLTRIGTSSSTGGEPTTIDELLAVQQSQATTLVQYHDRERTLKAIVPFRSPAETVIGCVSVSSSLRQADEMSDVRREIDPILIPLAVLMLVVMLHYFFTRGLTGRINRLGLAMIRARGGALGQRAPVDRPDELGAIARLFNETMEEIERASGENLRLLEEQKNFNAQLRERVKEATEELHAANARLRRANQELVETQRRLTRYERMAVAGQMAAAFAHEVGSPLSAISTHLELMSEEPGSSQDAKRRVRLIQEQVNRITGFVEELLSETRSAARAVGSVQVNDLLKQLLLFLAPHLERNRIQVVTAFQSDLPEIEADPQELQQVFLNLLNNAADAMPEGGTVKAETRLEQDPDHPGQVAVALSDNGVGIAPEVKRRIFEPYFSTKDLGHGTGLGLSIAARIVRKHAGSIEVASEPGAGTIFTIRFPVRAAKASISLETALP
jgi:signal transduction histidine kinase